MADRSAIEWTDKTWNPVIGCARISAGCEHCYAETMAARVALMQRAQGRESPYLRVVDVERRRWNRRAVLLPERLGEPLKWRNPCRVFVNSMSDLFHEDLSFEQVAAVFGVMAATPHLTYQVLTKRPARMLEFFAWLDVELPRLEAVYRALDVERWHLDSDAPDSLHRLNCADPEGPWPLPNVHLGVSVEDQRSADERIPLLLQCPAALRFLSVEPLLGPVNLSLPDGCCPACDGEAVSRKAIACGERLPSCDVCGPYHGRTAHGVDWVIVGGESGPGARPCNVSWIRSVVEQCKSAGVPVFVKQLGAAAQFLDRGAPISCDYIDRKGADPSEWPDDLRVQEFPEVRRA